MAGYTRKIRYVEAQPRQDLPRRIPSRRSAIKPSFRLRLPHWLSRLLIVALCASLAFAVVYVMNGG